MALDIKRVVADGYDAIAEPFNAQGGSGLGVRPWLELLAESVPGRGRVLDLGCGAGVPHTAWLAERFDVVGVDISREQLRRAVAGVPAVQFVLADMASVEFPAGYFDAIVAIYSTIHVPREEQPALLRSIRRWVADNGSVFLVMGGGDTERGVDEDWFGAPMVWSHYPAEENLRLIEAAGFDVTRSALVLDPIDADGRHLFALCRPR